MYCKDCDVRWAEEEGPECWNCENVPGPKALDIAYHAYAPGRSLGEALEAVRVQFNAGTGS